MACIGCGTLRRRACPEGDVLGVVGGTAAVVNGLRCVGPRPLRDRLPGRARSTVGLGDLKSREDVPLMDEWQETSVPGIFVAGELTGMALVKNAVVAGTQGGRPDRRSARRRTRGRGRGDAYDVADRRRRPRRPHRRGRSRASAGLSAVLLEQEPRPRRHDPPLPPAEAGAGPGARDPLPGRAPGGRVRRRRTCSRRSRTSHGARSSTSASAPGSPA